MNDIQQAADRLRDGKPFWIGRLGNALRERLDCEARSYVVREKCPQCGQVMLVTDVSIPIGQLAATLVDAAEALEPLARLWVEDRLDPIIDELRTIGQYADSPRRVCKTCRERLQQLPTQEPTRMDSDSMNESPHVAAQQTREGTNESD